MKNNQLHIKIVMISLMLSFSLVIPGKSGAAPDAPVGKVNRAEGTLFIQHPWDAGAAIAKVNDDLFPRDKIRTAAQSKASLTFINGAVLDIGEMTDIEIKELYYRPSDALSKSSFKMKLGRMRAFISKFTNPQSRFEIQTTTAVTGVVGTEQLVINEQTEKAGKTVDTTRAICTVGRVQVGSVDPAITGTALLDAFQQVWVYESEAPQEVMDLTMEELNSLLQEIMISLEEQKKGEVAPEEPVKRQKEEGPKEGKEEAKPEGILPAEIKPEAGKEEVPEIPHELEAPFIKEMDERMIGKDLAEDVVQEITHKLEEELKQQIIEDAAAPVEKDLPKPPGPPN